MQKFSSRNVEDISPNIQDIHNKKICVNNEWYQSCVYGFPNKIFDDIWVSK